MLTRISTHGKHTLLCSKNEIANKKYLIYKAKRELNNRRTKININVRPQINEMLMTVISIISMMSKKTKSISKM